MNKVLLVILLLLGACSEMKYTKTVEKVDIDKYMGKWYVIAGRFTFLEREVNNALEEYSWNEKEQRVDIAFHYNKGGLSGPVKSIPQKAWIINKETKAHWEVSPLWPFKADYLIIDLAEDYSWAVVGVPSQKYLWIMARDSQFSKKQVESILKGLEKIKYDIRDIIFVPHQNP